MPQHIQATAHDDGSTQQRETIRQQLPQRPIDTQAPKEVVANSLHSAAVLEVWANTSKCQLLAGSIDIKQYCLPLWILREQLSIQE